jgi:hypothetical protein
VATATRAHVRMGRSATHGQKLRRTVEARPMRTGGLQPYRSAQSEGVMAVAAATGPS